VNPPTEDIKDILESSAAGLGLALGTDLFVAKMPDEPDICYCLYDTGGDEPQANYEYQMPRVQVRARGKKGGYRNAWLGLAAVRDALHGVNNEVWNSTRYVGIWCESDILAVGYDDSNRPLLTVNLRIHRTTA
jgi:hypothetical protein